MQSLTPIITVPRRFWDREYGGCPLPKAVAVTFEVAGQPVDDVSAHGYVTVADDGELRLSGLWAVCQDRFPGHLVTGWSRVGDDTIKLQLQPPDSADEQHPGIDRKRQAPADLPEPQAKVQALSARLALEWDSPQQPGGGLLLDWRPEGRDGARLAGCAKLVRTTTRLYIGVGQVREWLGEVGARTELQVKVMLDNRMLMGVHQADLLYNKGAHYYWITSRTLKRTAMGKWFLGWSHNPTDGLVLLLRSPSKDEIAAAIAEGFQAKDDDDDTEVSEQQQAMQQQLQQQQQLLQALSPTSPHAGRLQAGRGVPGVLYGEDDLMMLMQQPLPGSEMEDATEGGHYHRGTPLGAGPRLGAAPDEDDAVSGLSGDSELRRALGPSDPRLMVAIAAAELQRGIYAGGGSPSAAAMGRRSTPGPAAGPGRGYTGGRDARELQQPPFPGGRSQPGPSGGAAAGQYPGRAGGEGPAAGAATTSPGQARGVAPAPGRLTNFSEVPGGTAFANVPAPSEQLGPEPSQLPPPQHRGAAAAVPSQLGATTSIASNLSLGGATQLTGPPSMLQASGVAGPVGAPLRLPANVSELLPPEYLPAAVSVRCTLDGSLQPDIFACEIHRNRQGYCYLYNLPPNVLEGRIQQDWMISEDGCLVLCLKTALQANMLVENKSVRSNPSNVQGAAALAGGASVNLDGSAGPGGLPSRGPSPADKPTRAQRRNSDPDLGVAAAAGPAAPAAAKPPPVEVPGTTCSDPTPKPADQPEQVQHVQEAPPAEPDTGAAGTDSPPGYVVAAMPVPERKPDGRKERSRQLTVPRQAIESLYGNVLLPHPVLLRYLIDGEAEQQVYLAEVAETGDGELYLRGASMEPLAGRTLVGWRRGSVLSHQLLIVCLETRPDAVGQAKAGAVTAGTRGEDARRSRNEQAPSPQLPPPQPPQQQAGHPSPQHQMPLPNWNAGNEAQLGSVRPPPNPAAANPFGHHQPSLSALTAAPSTQLPNRGLQQPQQQQGGTAGPGGASHRQQQPPQPLQPMLSGPLPGVGSSMLPPSLSLMNNASTNLLPAQASNLPLGAQASNLPLAAQASNLPLAAQASNLPFSASVRPEGNASVAAGGAVPGGGVNGNGRQPAGGPRGGAGTGGLLQAVASATQPPAASKPGAGAGRTAPAAPMFPWEGAAAGQAAPTVFAFGLGPGHEPPSPKGHLEPSASGKRVSQAQGAAPPLGRAAASALQSVAAESSLAPRNTMQSIANVGSHVRGLHVQHSFHQGGGGGGRRADDEQTDLELQRSPGRAGGSGDLDAATSNRGRARQTTAGTEGLGGVTGAQGMAPEPAGAGGQDGHPVQTRTRQMDRSQAQPQSWRFDVHPDAPRPEQEESLPDTLPSLASLVAGGMGLGRDTGRWEDDAGQRPVGGGGEPRGHTLSRLGEEPYAPGVGRPGTTAEDGEVGTSTEGGSSGAGAAVSSRAAAEMVKARPAQGASGGVQATGGPAGRPDSPRRVADESGDVEMEDAAPAAQPPAAGLGRPEDAHHTLGRTAPAATEEDPAATGALAEVSCRGNAMDADGPGAAPAPQTSSAWQQRRGDSGRGSLEGARQPLEPPSSGAGEAARPAPPPLQGGSGSQPGESSKQQQWFPRLDLTDATASAATRDQDAAGPAGASTTSKAGEGERPAGDPGEAAEESRPPARRGVLRMLSVVEREPEESDSQQQQRQGP